MSHTLVHCSYHKCLTHYFSKIHRVLFNYLLRYSNGYRHFNSILSDFYNEYQRYKVVSINNHALDLDKLPMNIKITRFIRDPRDLVVSGYFYHKRGAESWCNIIDPTPADRKIVNGFIPKEMPAGESFSSYLQKIDKESGLIAEINFRRNHFDSMEKWPKKDSRIKLFKYEDIIGNEKKIFSELFQFYGYNLFEKTIGLFLAEFFSVKKMSKTKKHIRNPKSGQWKEHFTSRVLEHFKNNHPNLLSRYEYK